ADDPYGKRLIAEGEGDAWSYGIADETARVRPVEFSLSASGIEARLATPHGELSIRSPLVGRLNLYNILAATTAALALGVPGDAVAEGLAGLSFVDGRLQRVAVPEGTGFDVVVDYAHTPDAMEKSLGCLREMTRGRLLVVFGCGGDRDRGKRPLMGEVAARMGDLVILTSDNPRSEVPEKIIEDIKPGVASMAFIDSASRDVPSKGCTVEIDRRRAIELALSWAAPGDIVFIGGKGHETYQIIGGKVHSFDDRVVVQDYFKARGDR
ncbi:MAG: Mur ligase family protein, partial [Acidobacteriota bacterium]